MPRARPLTKRQWQIVERVMADHALSLVEEIGEYGEEISALHYQDGAYAQELRRLAIETGHQLEADQAILSKVRERVQ